MHDETPTGRQFTDEMFLKLLNEVIPEIAGGQVRIVAMVRRPGRQTKVAVSSDVMNPLQACVGADRDNSQKLRDYLEGEWVQFIRYSDDLEAYIHSALKPMKAKEIHIAKDRQSAKIITRGRQKLKADAGHQNLRLASDLTGCLLQIRSHVEWGSGNRKSPNYVP